MRYWYKALELTEEYKISNHCFKIINIYTDIMIYDILNMYNKYITRGSFNKNGGK